MKSGKNYTGTIKLLTTWILQLIILYPFQFETQLEKGCL